MSVARTPLVFGIASIGAFLSVRTLAGCSAILDLDDPIVDGDASADQAVADRLAPPFADRAEPPVEAAPPDNCARAEAGAACGLTPQCGCTQTETCDVVDGAGTVACVAAGLAGLGEACTLTASCSRGLTCIFGACHAYCQFAGSTCTAPSNGECRQVKNPSQVAIPNLKVCRIDCDLRNVAACGATNASGAASCAVDDAGATDCVKAGTRAEAESCSPMDDCGPGLVCVTQSALSICRRWCRVGEPDCTTGSCAGFAQAVVVKGVEYGACL